LCHLWRSAVPDQDRQVGIAAGILAASRIVRESGKGVAEFRYRYGTILPRRLFHDAGRRRFGLRSMVEPKLVPECAAGPVEKTIRAMISIAQNLVL